MLKSMNRAVHFDFHTNRGIYDFGANFDAEKFARQLTDARVGYINLFAQCNLGFSYYPTEIGVPYPTMKGDMFGEALRACKKAGIGVSAYVNIGLNHEQAVLHPEWLKMNKEGQTYNFAEGGNYFRRMCVNTGYHDYVVSVIKEIVNKYDPDGFFCDGITLKPCYCRKCMNDMLERGIDTTDEAAVTKFADEQLVRICQDIRNAVPQGKRLCLVPMPQHYVDKMNTHYEVECLPSVWSYDFFVAHTAFARPLYDSVLYMNGRFQTDWGDLGGYKGRAAIENDFYDALCQGATTSLGDHLHPARNPIDDIFKDLGEMYAKIESYEKWTDKAKFIPEMALLSDCRWLGDAHNGAARMLSELKYSFDIVDVNRDFSKYDLLILPDEITVTDALKEKLKAHLLQGKKIISSGISGLTADGSGFALCDWDFEYLGPDPENKAYYSLSFEEKGLAKMQYSMYCQGILMKKKAGGRSLAAHVSAYFNDGYNGRDYLFYTPPTKESGADAAIINAKGNVAHISFPVFSSYLSTFAQPHKALVKKILSIMYPNNLIKAESLPDTARATLTGCSEYKLLHVKVTYPELRGKMGIITEHTELIGGKKISVKGEYKTVKKLPEGETVVSEIEDGYTVITLPDIVGYEMFLLK